MVLSHAALQENAFTGWTSQYELLQVIKVGHQNVTLLQFIISLLYVILYLLI